MAHKWRLVNEKISLLKKLLKTEFSKTTPQWSGKNLGYFFWLIFVLELKGHAREDRSG